MYVENHCKAIDLIIYIGKVEVYNGEHNEMRNIDIVKIICKELDKPKNLMTYVTDKKGHDMRYALILLRFIMNLDGFQRLNLKMELKR